MFRVHRHDVVMDAKRKNQHSEDKIDQANTNNITQQAGSEWLIKRSASHGFIIDEDGMRVEAYRQHRSRKPGHTIAYSTLDFTGVLQVDAPEPFVSSLINGIGPAKAFGCGLLLVRRL